MDGYVAAVKVTWYEEFSGKSIEDYLFLTNVKSYAEVAKRVEEYYADDLEEVSITFLEGPFLKVSEETYEEIKNAN